jgi:hypothetical protein
MHILLPNSVLSLALQVTNCKHEFHLQCILEWYSAMCFNQFFLPFFLSDSSDFFKTYLLALCGFPFFLSFNLYLTFELMLIAGSVVGFFEIVLRTYIGICGMYLEIWRGVISDLETTKIY